MERYQRTAGQLRDQCLAHAYVMQGEPLSEAAFVDYLRNPEALEAELADLEVEVSIVLRNEAEDPQTLSVAERRLESLRRVAQVGFEKGFGITEFHGGLSHEPSVFRYGSKPGARGHRRHHQRIHTL